MVGSGGSDRSKEAAGMMALHEALRSVCLNSDWTYSVFWTIRTRPRSRGGNACKVGDENGSLMLMWEDGFCRGRPTECLENIDGEDPVRKAFSKMSIQLYNYGEGLMGKVASDKCHKWVFKEPSESESNVSNYWQSSFDAIPPEWTDQFNSGIQTIAVIQAGHGLLQLGSCMIIPEDLHFVLRMRHTFESLGYQSGFYMSHLFSATRNTSSSPIPSKHSTAPSLSPIFNWSQRPLSSAANVVPSPSFQNSARLGISQTRDETHPFILPNSSDVQMEDMIADHDSDIKWPNGLSFFNALTGQSHDSKLLFGAEAVRNRPSQQQHPLILGGRNSNSAMNLSGWTDESKVGSEALNSQTHHRNGNDNTANATANDYLTLQNHPNNDRKMENKFKRSFTMPARMASSSSYSLNHHQHNLVDYRSSETGSYSDIMENFLE